MYKISVIYSKNYKSHHDVFPLRVYKNKIAKINIRLSFFHNLNNKALKGDAIFISSYQAKKCFNSFAKKNRIKNNDFLSILELIKNYGLSVIWFDTSDTTSFYFSHLIGIVDVYLKNQFIIKKNNHSNSFVNSNPYYDYFLKKIEKNKNRKIINHQKNNYENVMLGWNLALSDWKIHSQNRLYRALNILFPSINSDISFNKNPINKRKNNLWFFAENKKNNQGISSNITNYHRTLLRQSIKKYNNKHNFTNYNESGLEYNDYLNLLIKTAVVVSPFGKGEICYRDFEALFSGCVLIKPDMNHLKTWPNIYIPMKTYIPCAWDFSDLEQKVNWVNNNLSQAQDIATYGQNMIYDILFSSNDFVLRFKNIINNALNKN